jgi:hypothetical protein
MAPASCEAVPRPSRRGHAVGLRKQVSKAAPDAETLLSAVAAVFALGTGVAAAAEATGKEQGLLDGAIGWFKSWFRGHRGTNNERNYGRQEI